MGSRYPRIHDFNYRYKFRRSHPLTEAGTQGCVLCNSRKKANFCLMRHRQRVKCSFVNNKTSHYCLNSDFSEQSCIKTSKRRYIKTLYKPKGWLQPKPLILLMKITM